MNKPRWPNKSNGGFTPGLERMYALLAKLGNPQNKLKNVFHVAGTNGKGSVTSFLKTILEEAGYKVNRFVSPYVVCFNERIQPLGQYITDEYYDEIAEEVRTVVEKYKLEITYFEALTVIGIVAFSRNDANANVIEVGCGGRFDSTNVFENPLVDIITNISFDHMEYLGNTLQEIAYEKFGIARSSTPLIIGPQCKETTNYLIKQAEHLGCPYYASGEQWKYTELDDRCAFEGIFKMLYTPKPRLQGKHQINNAGTAIAAILAQNKLVVSDEAIKRGIKKAFWPARLQDLTDTTLGKLLPRGFELWLDGAHNPDGARVLSEWVGEHKDGKESIIILAILEKKDYSAYIKAIVKSVHKFVLLANAPDENFQFAKAEILEEALRHEAAEILGCTEDVTLALKMIASKHADSPKRIIITGSLYFASTVLQLINK